jgi:hypothetical protein
MYNLVVLKNKIGYVTSVFDRRGNEIWNNVNYADLLVDDLAQQHFSIDNVLFDDWSLFCVQLLATSKLFNKDVKLISISDVPQEELFIANECMGVYGKARYVHRMFLKDKNKVAC